MKQLILFLLLSGMVLGQNKVNMILSVMEDPVNSAISFNGRTFIFIAIITSDSAKPEWI